MSSRFFLRALTLGALLLTSAAPALAAPCGTGPFETWLEDFKKEAAAKGISASAIQAGLTGVTLDKSVLTRDQSQKVFSQTFEEFSGRMVPPRLTRGANMLKQYGSVLGRIEEKYGVPGEVLVAIWGLETDYGVNIGKFQTLRALATLAYDCRRTDLFKAELMDALRIVERGDIAPQDLRGAWAGEIGQTQFMPSSYIKYAVDFDSNGRRDLLRSAPGRAGLDRQFPGQPWLETRQGMGARQRQFRCDQGVEQERGLRQDHRPFRDPAFARAVTENSKRWEFKGRNSKGRPSATGPLPIGLLGHARLHCLAQMRRAGARLAVQHRILGSRDFLLGRHLALAISHVLDHRFSLAHIVAAAARLDSRGVGWRDGVRQDCHRGGCEYFVEHGSFLFVFGQTASLPSANPIVR